MRPPTVSIASTGVANIASIRAAFTRLGAETVLIESPDEIEAAGAVVLPGVGAFGPAMDSLRERGLAAPLRERILGGRPTLCICLGMQLLAEWSDESPGDRGLGVVAGRIERFPHRARTPQMGWNRVETPAGHPLLGPPGHAYFANSFRLTEAPGGWAAATAAHAGRFIAALARENVLACQFHPELSGKWGAALLGRWLAAARKETATC